MELLVEMYNLPYSDSRLIQVENILKSLDKNEPLENNTQILEPIDQVKELYNHLKLRGIIKNGN